jgi:hypothetical protein
VSIRDLAEKLWFLLKTLTSIAIESVFFVAWYFINHLVGIEIEDWKVDRVDHLTLIGMRVVVATGTFLVISAFILHEVYISVREIFKRPAESEVTGAEELADASLSTPRG